jgi:hypothetical protein
MKVTESILLVFAVLLFSPCLMAFVETPVFLDGVCILDTSNACGYLPAMFKTKAQGSDHANKQPPPPNLMNKTRETSVVAIDRKGNLVKAGLSPDSIGSSFSVINNATEGSHSTSESHVSFEQSGKHGLREVATGKIVIDAQWDSIQWISRAHRALGRINGGYMILKESGEPVSEEKWDMVLMHSASPAVVALGKKRGLVNPNTGKIIVRPEWDDIEWHHLRSSDEPDAGFAIAMSGNRLNRSDVYCILNAQGDPVSDARWTSIRVQSKKLAIVIKDGRQGAISPMSGKIILPATQQKIFRPRQNKSDGDEMFCAIDDSGVGRLYDCEGNIKLLLDDLDVALALKMDFRNLFVSDGFFAYPKKSGWGMIDMNGKIKIPFKYDVIGRGNGFLFDEGAALVCLNEKLGFLDANGNSISDMRWDACGYFSQGMAYVVHGSRWGFIDKTGEVVIGPFEMGPLGQ